MDSDEKLISLRKELGTITKLMNGGPRGKRVSYSHLSRLQDQCRKVFREIKELMEAQESV